MEGWCYRVCLTDELNDEGFYWFFDMPEDAVSFAQRLARNDGAYAEFVRIEFVRDGDET